MDEGRTAALHALEERLGHRFADLALLDRALTHTSHAHERGALAARHNEPLEFLGDAVIGFVVAEMLHRRDPEGNEGGKSKARAHLVAAPSLARRAARLGVPDLLSLGRGEEKSGGRQKSALWADAYEAVVAALYLDGGLEAAARFVTAEFAADLASARSAGAGRLQERPAGVAAVAGGGGPRIRDRGRGGTEAPPVVAGPVRHRRRGGGGRRGTLEAGGAAGGGAASAAGGARARGGRSLRQEAPWPG